MDPERWCTTCRLQGRQAPAVYVSTVSPQGMQVFTCEAHKVGTDELLTDFFERVRAGLAVERLTGVRS